MDSEVKICCICGKPFTGWGNNPYPVVKTDGAECCDECNLEKVVPARIIAVTKSEVTEREALQG